ncbi:NUDIX hydrolase [Microterricola viridarii]|uniref:ADP-ribose pyrophosphatase n=1 Tax=Microterricola viridarii TaxID=412690 RepID=A0A0Y0P7G8_9MICO|nr:NUDIX domain-containing protein [Microterricola viridarii]AMB60204.1 ADP-ribose pyrophosphatase [Microterricola viridarii]
MATPDFVLALREKIGTAPLWLSGATAVVLRARSASDSAASGSAASDSAASGSHEVLLVRRADNGAWTPVTGIIDPGEEPADAAAREVLEEAGVVAEVERLAWVQSLPERAYVNGDRAAYLDLVFRCRWVSGQPHPADGENTDAAWFPLDALPEMSPNMRERIAEALKPAGPTRFNRT